MDKIGILAEAITSALASVQKQQAKFFISLVQLPCRFSHETDPLFRRC